MTGRTDKLGGKGRIRPYGLNSAASYKMEVGVEASQEKRGHTPVNRGTY
jgi:hypothetical protein